MKYKFRKGFLWGVAISGYQTEGNGVNTDWWYYEKNKKKTDKYPEEESGIANDFWNRYEEDIDLAKELNSNTIRLGIEWARIEPSPGQFDEEAIFHYKKIFQYAKSKNLKIFLTIHHFTIPLWFAEMGGFLNMNAPKIFTSYAMKCLEEFKDYIDFVISINEPEVYSYMGYIRGSWPPKHHSNLEAVIVNINFLRCHSRFYKLAKEKYSFPIGIVKNITAFSAREDSALDRFTASVFYFINSQILLIPILNKLDFIGLNYYFSNQIKNFNIQNPCDPESDTGWWVDFDGLKNVLIQLRKYQKDIYITENGLADASDEKRKWFIKNMLISCYEAIENYNVPLKGYLHWTLCDNYEWHHGYWPQFGLVKIQRDRTLKRVKRPSFDFYQLICKTNIVEDTIY